MVILYISNSCAKVRPEPDRKIITALTASPDSVIMKNLINIEIDHAFITA